MEENLTNQEQVEAVREIDTIEMAVSQDDLQENVINTEGEKNLQPSGDLYELTKQIMGIEKIDILNYSPLTLAYIGDGVYELVIRTLVVSNGNTQVNKMHKMSASLVKAQTQSAMVEEILPLLTPEEESAYRRGRNAKSATSAKNASIQDYRRATGLEALVGYLYLTSRSTRMMELIQVGLEKLQEKGIVHFKMKSATGKNE